jgi:hypothetical protein
MTAAEIGEIKKSALERNGGSGPWKDHELRMWCKTSVHRAFKTLPRPTNPDHADKIQRSQEIDDRNDLSEGLDPVINADFEDEQPMLAAGSTELQEKAAETKISELKNSGADKTATGSGAASSPPSASAPLEDRPLTAEENRKLDAQLASQEEAEAARSAAANRTQQAPRPKLQFGRKA